MQLPTSVTDINGATYALGRLLGEGGQGAVAVVHGSQLAVKLLHDRSPARRESLRRQLNSVRRLALADLCIARPLEMLREPDLGYVMEFLTGMEPLQKLAQPPRGEPSLAVWYINGGGLRRRLRLLARIADTLSALHGKGLVYGDISPHNVFVSADAAAFEAWLIDADNVRYESAPAAPGAYTAGYGAPELITGRTGANTLTDAHAFAVLAFQTLAITHPFVGDVVSNGEPELEERAMLGELPWIEDPSDNSNQASFGVARDRVLSPKLRAICQQAFVAGIKQPMDRPGMAEWSDRLHTAADLTITCPECRASFYATAHQCPWCGSSRPSCLFLAFSLWDPAAGKEGAFLRKPASRGGKRDVVVANAATTVGVALIVTGRLANGLSGSRAEDPVVEVMLQNGRLKLQCLDGSSCWVSAPSDGRPVELSKQPRSIPAGDDLRGWCLHFGSRDRLHRAATFLIKEGGSHEGV